MLGNKDVKLDLVGLFLCLGVREEGTDGEMVGLFLLGRLGLGMVGFGDDGFWGMGLGDDGTDDSQEWACRAVL